MRINRLITLLLPVALLTALKTSAIPNSDEISVQLAHRLSRATSHADSTKILYDLFDLAAYDERGTYAHQLLNIAVADRNDTMALDMIRHLVNLNSSSEATLCRLDSLARTFPESAPRSETLSFLELRRAGRVARYASDAERLMELKDAIEAYQRGDSTDAYGRVERVAKVAVLLGSHIHPTLIKKYLDEALDLLDDLPSEDFAVRNVVLNQAANLYTNLGLSDEANAANRRMLGVLDKMVKQYDNNGRHFRRFETYYYTTYRCMLQNYPSLTPEEVEDIYGRILSLAAINDDVARDMRHGCAKAYYLMARGEYAKAIPMLRHIQEITSDNFIRHRALRQIIKASRATGDNATLVDALTDYNTSLYNYITSQAQDSYAELNALYKLNNLQRRNAQLELEHARERVEAQHVVQLISIIAIAALLAVIGLLIWQIAKSRRLAARLANLNTDLNEESENLRRSHDELVVARDRAYKAERHKSEFVDNMSHEITTPLEAIVEYSQLIVDCADPDKKAYLQSYADIVRVNTELLLTLVSDVLEVGRMDEGKITVTPLPSEISEMCRLAIETVRPNVAKGVRITFTPPEEADSFAITDHRRVEQVLINLLSNAAKFTSQGTIDLRADVDRPDNTVTFTVTDTGCGIPAGKEDAIFQRFVKLDKNIPGTGLGLSICRMIAALLHGTVTVDPTYRRGARFTFTIPLS